MSVNLPRIGLKLQSKTTEERIAEYFLELDKVCEMAHKALQMRLKRLSTVKAKQAPICWQYGGLTRLKADDYILPSCKNGRASISLGYVGVNEAVHQIFLSDDTLLDNKEMKKVSEDIVKFLSDKCKEWKEKEHFGYSLYSTPAESLAHVFETKDRKEFGVVRNVTDKEYYTNSFHLDVRVKTDPFTKIKFESVYPHFQICEILIMYRRLY